MIIVGLDLSMTSSGYAVLDSGKLIDFGVIKSTKEVAQFTCLDYEYIDRAKLVAQECKKKVDLFSPDLIMIEQTNKGRNRNSQKKLEFVHFAVLTAIESYKDVISYVDTSFWRATLKIVSTKEDSKHNKLVNAKKAEGKITPKHRAVRWVNKTYDLSLKLKDNDIADAIAVAYFAWKRHNTVNDVNALSDIDTFFDRDSDG